MKVLEEYNSIVEMSRKRRNAGKIECKFRPITEYGQIMFGKHIEVEVNNRERGIFHRLLDFAEVSRTKKNLNDENYARAGFDKWIEIGEFEATEEGYPTFKQRVMERFKEQYHMSYSDFKLELGEFIPHPKVKELDFDDIPDLRKGVK